MSKTVRLTEHLVLDTTRDSYVVGEPAISKDGNAYLRGPKYFTNLAYALEYAVDYSIRKGLLDGKYATLTELLTDFKQLKVEIEGALIGSNLIQAPAAEGVHDY